MGRPLNIVLLVAWIVGAVAAGVTVRPAPSESADDRTARTSAAPVEVTLDGPQVVLTVVVPGEGKRHLGAPVPGFLSAWLHEDPKPRSPSDDSPREDSLLVPVPLFMHPSLP